MPTTTEQEYSEAYILEGLQITYEDWTGPGPFSFENVQGKLDEFEGLTREQFNRFTGELNYTRCGICGVECGQHTCEDHLDAIESDLYAAEFDAAWAAGKEG